MTARTAFPAHYVGTTGSLVREVKAVRIPCPVLPTSDTAAKDFRKQKRHTDWAKNELAKGIKTTLNAFDDHHLPTCEARYRANEIR